MKHFIEKINFQLYFALVSIFSIYLATAFLSNIPVVTIRDQVHAVLIVTTYGVIYQLPAAIAYFLLKKWKRFALSIAVLLSVSAHILIFADSQLYDLYGFHINGFVWNIVTTKGGIASLGADQTNYSLVALYAGILLFVHITALFTSIVFTNVHIRNRTLISLFLFASLSERLIYGYSLAQLYGPVLDRGDAFPFYKQMKMNSFLKKIGVDVKQSHHLHLSHNDSTLDYPKHKILYTNTNRPKKHYYAGV